MVVCRKYEKGIGLCVQFLFIFYLEPLNFIFLKINTNATNSNDHKITI